MPTTTRRAAARLALGLLAAAGLLGSGPALAADPVRVGILPLTSHAPSIIAAGRGYFAEADIELSFVPFQAAQPMAVAIASGDVDFGVTAITGGLISLAERGAVKVIGGALQETEGVAGQKILASKAAYDAGVTTPKDLEGRRFGITQAGSSFHYMAHKIADQEGFARDSLELVPLNAVPTVIASLRTGQIDAWSIVPNIASGLVASGDVVEIGRIGDYIPNYQVTTIFTAAGIVEENPGLVERFLEAFSRGVDDYNAALVDQTMPEGETDELVAMIHEHIYTDRPIEAADPAIRAGAMRINANGRLNLESVADQLEWFKSEGLVPQTATIETLVDTSFVETD
jgi:NitT/TauT family transport system substrate-binding protein